jgi:hypothetical protein
MQDSTQILLALALWLLGGVVSWALVLIWGLRFEWRPEAEDGAIPDLEMVPLVQAGRRARIRPHLHNRLVVSQRRLRLPSSEGAGRWAAIRRN